MDFKSINLKSKTKFKSKLPTKPKLFQNFKVLYFTNFLWVLLTYAHKAYISKSFKEIFYQKLKKLSNFLTTFLILNKKILKINY